MGIVTDSGAGRPENVYAIHKLFRDEKELEKLYAEKEGKYKELKEALIEDVKAFIKPMREKRDELLKDKKVVLEIIKRGGEKARERAENKMKIVREVTGLTLN
jgi:tryptophanyl-tRNA synthetase